jgi:ribosomal protein S18 acetylase RimI-like enzyme
MRFRVDEAGSESDGAVLWPVYRSVFDDYSDYRAWREGVWDRHRARDGFRLVRAYDGEAHVGFAYGYTGATGQWWTDNARKVLDPDVAERWLGGHFELVSIGVIEAVRHRGVGRELMRVLLRGLPHQRLLLMTTSDPEDPARRLYASEGWRVLGPGIGEDTVIMCRRAEGH